MSSRSPSLLDSLIAADQDFEWYPTTDRIISAIRRDCGTDLLDSAKLLDIGAGDGRVLLALSTPGSTLYSIEKAPLLQQAQPARIIPVGVDFHEQNLMSLPVDIAFSNPPYLEYAIWAERIIATVYARRLYLVLPQRWKASSAIIDALAARSATARVIHHDDFQFAERPARAVIDVIRIDFEASGARYGYGRHQTAPAQDPFDLWFDQHIDTFDRPDVLDDDALRDQRIARLRTATTIPDLVDAYNEEHTRMEENYKAIFRLDFAILKELGINKDQLRAGLKEKIAGLKNAYWALLFDRLDTLTQRLTTETRTQFLRRLTGQTAIAFTAPNAYAIVLWAIKEANSYFDGQLIKLFRDLSTREGSANYTSNQRTWEARSGWRYFRQEFSHYTLDYRIVLPHHSAIHNGGDFNRWDYHGGLHKSAHDLIADVIAVCANLGFRTAAIPSTNRIWVRNEWQDFEDHAGTVIFQVKGFQNGNLQWRFRQEVIKAINIEAGRLLGWVRSAEEAATETGCTPEDAARYFHSQQRIGRTLVPLLDAGAP